MTIYDSPTFWTVKGMSFTGAADETVGSDESLSLLLDNPSGSGRRFLAFFGEMSHEDDTRFTVYDAVENVSGGDEVDVSNNAITPPGVDSPTPTGELIQDPTFDTVNDHHVVYFGSGTQQILDGYRLYIDPGAHIVFDMQNRGGSNELSTRISWFEVPEGTGWVQDE